ncbi:MAG: hypothetical protein ACTSUE_25540 [Promethearchaeota archaeon]
MLNSEKLSGIEKEGDDSPSESKILVKAVLACPNCGYRKAFKNKFDREEMEMLVVSAKVMAWSVCDCGELIEFSLEFEI